MVRVMFACSAAIAAALSASAPASSDDSDYLAVVQEDVPYVYNQYGKDTLLNLGYNVCKWNSQGLQDLDIIAKIRQAAPMSASAASSIMVDAQYKLGC